MFLPRIKDENVREPSEAKEGVNVAEFFQASTNSNLDQPGKAWVQIPADPIKDEPTNSTEAKVLTCSLCPNSKALDPRSFDKHNRKHHPKMLKQTSKIRMSWKLRVKMKRTKEQLTTDLSTSRKNSANLEKHQGDFLTTGLVENASACKAEEANSNPTCTGSTAKLVSRNQDQHSASSGAPGDNGRFSTSSVSSSGYDTNRSCVSSYSSDSSDNCDSSDISSGQPNQFGLKTEVKREPLQAGQDGNLGSQIKRETSPMDSGNMASDKETIVSEDQVHQSPVNNIEAEKTSLNANSQAMDEHKDQKNERFGKKQVFGLINTRSFCNLDRAGNSLIGFLSKSLVFCEKTSE